VIFSSALYGELLAAPADKGGGGRGGLGALGRCPGGSKRTNKASCLNLNDPDMLRHANGKDED